MSQGIAYLLVFGAIICNGSYLVPFKSPAVNALKINDNIFAFYFSIGAFLSSMIIMALTPLNSKCVSGAANATAFVPFGFVGGLILMVSIGCNFVATSVLGISLNTGIFSGCSICTSIFWGLAIFQEPVTNYALLVLGLLFLISGIISIANIDRVVCFLNRRWPTSGSESLSDPINIENGRTTTTTVSMSIDSPMLSKELSVAELFSGVLWSIGCGVSGGTILVPLHYVPPSQNGFVFLPAFGFGVFIGGLVLLIISFFLNNKTWPNFHWEVAAPYGVLSGVIWNINNVLVIIAIPILGYALAFPLVQLAILVAGTWGIFRFGELRGRAIPVFYCCTVIVFLGAIMLAFGLQ